MSNKIYVTDVISKRDVSLPKSIMERDSDGFSKALMHNKVQEKKQNDQGASDKSSKEKLKISTTSSNGEGIQKSTQKAEKTTAEKYAQDKEVGQEISDEEFLEVDVHDEGELLDLAVIPVLASVAQDVESVAEKSTIDIATKDLQAEVISETSSQKQKPQELFNGMEGVPKEDITKTQPIVAGLSDLEDDTSNLSEYQEDARVLVVKAPIENIEGVVVGDTNLPNVQIKPETSQIFVPMENLKLQQDASIIDEKEFNLNELSTDAEQALDNSIIKDSTEGKKLKIVPSSFLNSSLRDESLTSIEMDDMPREQSTDNAQIISPVSTDIDELNLVNNDRKEIFTFQETLDAINFPRVTMQEGGKLLVSFKELPPEAQAIPRSEQIALAIRSASQNNRSEVTLTMYPETLGTVDIKIEFSKIGEVHAIKFFAERPDTLRLLLNDYSILERSLSEVVKADNASLSFNLRDGQNDGNSDYQTVEERGLSFLGVDEKNIQTKQYSARHILKDDSIDIKI